MRIAYLVAGSGNMHCGACTHDFLFISELRRLAHEVRVIPLYTPFWSDMGLLPERDDIFMGGIGMYLRVQKPALARLLAPFRRFLDSPRVLSFATRNSIKTDPRDLGPMCASMLQGTDGPHAQEYLRLLDHIQHTVKPEVVILSNSMFAPLAPLLRERLGVPILAHFQGEDSFIMALPDPYCEQVIGLLRSSAAALSAVICPGQSGLQQAGLLLQIPEDRLHIIPAPLDATPFAPQQAPPREPFTVGYLSVVRPAKGLDILLRAMQQVGDSTDMALRVLIGGQILNAEYAGEMRRLARSLMPRIAVEFGGEITLEQKVGLLRRSHLFVLPTRIHEARALAAMEAMAAGVPVAAPRLGILPELLAPGGGYLFEAGDVDSLARIIRKAAADPIGLSAASTHARTTIQQHHTPAEVTGQLESLMTQLLHGNADSV